MNIELRLEQPEDYRKTEEIMTSNPRLPSRSATD